MKVLKGLRIALAVLVALLIIAVLALVLLLDPDIFKPRIEAIAREHNVALNIKGDLDWQFWPALAIEINDVDAATLDDQPLAKFSRASLRVAVVPLFRREVAVEHVLLQGAVIDLTVDENGRGNWEALTATETDAASPPAPAEPAAAQEQPDETAPDGEGAQLQLAADRISLHDSALNFTSLATSEGGGQRLAVRDVSMEIEGFNLQAEPFSMALQWQGELSDEALFGDQPITISGNIAQQVQLTSDMNQVDVTEGRLALQVADTPLQLTYSASLRDIQDQLRYFGEFALAPVNLKQLLTATGQEAPVTSADYALTQVGLAANFTGDTSAVALEPFALTLDKTRLGGRVAITDFSTSALQLVLEGDTLNADDYLPPATEEAAAPEPTTTGDEVIIPIDTLQALSADVKVDFEQLTVSTIPLQQVGLHLSADAGLVSLERLNANVYGGNLSAVGKLDARGDTAALDFQGEVASVQLGPFLEGRELNEKIQLSGAINADAQGQARGVTMNELMNSGKGQATFSGTQVRLAPLNVEEQFCQIVHLVNKAPASQQDWPDYTEMTELNGKVSYANQVLSVDEFAAGVSQLLVGVDGQVDLGKGDYNLGLPLMLTESQTSPNGCRVESDYWLNRSLGLLRCRGSLEGLSPVNDCRPDAQGLTKLVRDYGEYQLKARHGDKIDAAEQKLDEKKDELRQKLQEELGTEEGKKIEDRLRQLFGR